MARISKNIGQYSLIIEGINPNSSEISELSKHTASPQPL